MELTKFERRVTDPHYLRKCRWYYLYLGLAFVATGLFVVAYGYIKHIPQTTAVWELNVELLQKIVPSTKNEKDLFEMTRGFLGAAKLGWTRFAEEKTRSTSMYFLFIGAFLLGTYFREKRYRKLIDKLGAPNQVL